MHVQILVVTGCRDVSQMVGKTKMRLFSDKVIRKASTLGVTVSVSSILLTQPKSDEILDYFIRHSATLSGAIVILDDNFSFLLSDLAPSLFSVIVSSDALSLNIQNCLRSAYNSSLDIFLSIYERFQNFQYKKIFLLPYRNFLGSDFEDLAGNFRKGIVDRSLIQKVDEALSRIRKRQKPKTSSTYRDTYLADDQKRFFQMGKEKHAKAETGQPPHSKLCVLNSKFRFGNKFDENLHYNVSFEGDDISGVFADCHDRGEIVGTKSHLNIFPNDYYC